ncbi:hypothetical protein AN286_06915 [Aliarcobacter cryaerophilus ATCC 43158]|uniref:Alpha-1,2-fucosyltransferase n=1 Tax=Aliarcobacter cryaerophilus ATCC 43158 TaxID=1032070 RepID=A0AAD0X8P0_9BACT|nr:alpha-1,2-fucosyltransferase [Aliarcobacter cryaerophilus]AYJ79899.1 alpha-1,2-fucosyltransferase [Aliarcobacter cryaerophilus ATCC 43158]PRM96885.1 hypothetical protein CJ667_06665 [Aliarcobacter cryaerophilus]QCZ24131.1 hypothetical protein AN286_06915 [Aliarcobacter cryaerophilus ATCC 43158]
MIIVKLIGGLTSQMHKYALGKVLALKHNVPLKLDLSWFDDKEKTDTAWPYQLEFYGIKEDIATPEEIKKLKGSDRYCTFARRVKHYLGLDIYKKTYINTSFLSVDEFNNLESEIYLEGEWIGFQYLENYKDTIKKLFTYPIKLNDNINFIKKDIQSVNSVFLHIRRGDFLSHPGAAKFHSVCGLDYYSKALEIVKSKVDEPSLYIFSDDIKWAKENLKFDINMKFMDGNNNYEDLLLMSTCKHSIIANSGFSSWGAWLNKNKNKVVIAPEKWVQDDFLNKKFLEFLKSDNLIFVENQN